MDADTETFDKYACAALTGLLANPAYMQAVCLEKGSNLGVMKHVAGVAINYANLAVESRKVVLGSLNAAQSTAH